MSDPFESPTRQPPDSGWNAAEFGGVEQVRDVFADCRPHLGWDHEGILAVQVLADDLVVGVFAAEPRPLTQPH